MPISYQSRFVAIVVVMLVGTTALVRAQSINGTVTDPTGAVVPNATVEIHNPVSKYDRSTSTDTSGKFTFPTFRSIRTTWW